MQFFWNASFALTPLKPKLQSFPSSAFHKSPLKVKKKNNNMCVLGDTNQQIRFKCPVFGFQAVILGF